MDLRSLLPGRSVLNFKTFTGIKFTRERSVKTRNKLDGSVRDHKDQKGAATSIKETKKNQQSDFKGTANIEHKSHNVTGKGKHHAHISSKSGGIRKQLDIDGAAATGNDVAETAKNLFPRNTHWFVFLFTVVFRVWYVCRRQNWWVLHPDEIYQTLEVAHSEAYGYGFRTYEYLPEKLPGYHVSAARAQEVELGMYSLRSFMLPHLISVSMVLADSVGLLFTPYLVGRVILAVVSSFLPLAVYGFTNTIFRSHDTATMTVILVATSQTMNVFGTHPLVNSFLAPFVFLSLNTFVKIMLRDEDEMQEITRKPHKNQKLYRDQNSNLPVINKNHNQSKKTSVSDLKSRINIEQNLKVWTHENRRDYSKPYFKIRFDTSEFLSGVCLSLCIYTRCDIVLLPAFIVLAFTYFSCRKLFRLVLYLHVFLGGFITGFLIGGCYDRLCYGIWFISPHQWIKFNVFHSASHVLFGSESCTFYIEKVLFGDSFHVVLSAVLLIDLAAALHLLPNHANERFHGNHIKSVPFLVFLMMFLTYSFSAHKELRFFHNGIIFMYIHQSSAIFRLLQIIVKYANQKHGQYYNSFYLFIGFLASSQLFSFVQIHDKGISKWTYSGNDVSHHVNQCLDYINQQHDVNGVFLDQPIYMTGGYTILHKDVPIYALNNYEFIEFSRSSRISSSNAFNQNVSLSAFGYISDFVSMYNTPYLLKQLILKSQYNYLVLDIERQFIETGYNEVFRAGSIKVMKRLMTNESEAEHLKMASDIPVGYNATILEYEGYWLLRFGLYKEAEEKLLFSNRLDQSRLGPYHLLMGMFNYFKQDGLVKNVLDACLTVHERSLCLSEYRVIKLHESYYRDVDILYST